MNGMSNDRNGSKLGGVLRIRTKFIGAFFFAIALVTAVVLANTSTYTYETGLVQLGPQEEIWSREMTGFAGFAGIVPMSSGVVHRIETPADLAAFLRSEPIRGAQTANNDEFIIDGTINMQGQGSFQGRGFVGGQPFTGLLIGENNATITNLDLVPRTAAEPPDTQGHNDFGLIRVLGDGAVIENLIFSNVNYSDPAGLASWNNVEGNIGLVAGRILPNSTVIMNNITIHGATSDANAAITFAGGARETNNKRVGGLVGATDFGSVLRITNVDVRLQVALSTTGTPGAIANRNVHTSGGLIGLAAGDVHIDSAGQFVNRVHFQPILTTAGGSRAFLHVGGVIGRLTSPTAGANASTIYRLHTSTAGAVVPVTQSLGGFIGDSQHVTITHSENHFGVTSAIHRGGFIGISRGNIVINDSHNYGVIGNGGTTATGVGGFIGAMLSGNANFARSENRAHRSAVTDTAHHGGFIGISRGNIVFYHSHNRGDINDTGTTTAAAGVNVGRGGFIGFMDSGSVNFYRTRNYGVISTDLFGRLGGFVGRALGAGTITIEHGENRGNVRVRSTATGTAAEVRTRVTSAGGFVGYTTTSLSVTDSSNHAYVRVHGRGGGGGIAGSTSSRGGTSTTLVRVANYGVVYGQHTQDRFIGGFIGNSRNAVNITNSVNHATVRLTSSGADGAATINRNNAIGGFIGNATGAVFIADSENRGNVTNDGANHRAGGRMRVAGFVGMASNRLEIERSHNYGDITSVRAGTGGTTAHHGAGGIVGRITFRGTRLNRFARITDVSNSGVVNGTGRAGGIVGSTGHRVGVPGLTISNAVNTGDVRSWVVGGGIIGQSNTVNARIEDVVNTGNVLVHNVGTPATNRGGLISGGGIVGRSSRNNLQIARAGNDGSVTVISTNATTTGTGRGANGLNNTNTAGAGGIVGNIQRGTRNQITLSYNAGAIRGHMRGVGGIIGSIRRTGTTLIQDTYNVGLVYSTRPINTGGTATTGTDGAQPGNGILGLRRNVVGMVTMERVYNSGNVSGHPIFRGTRGFASARGTAVGVTRRVTYRDVFFDTSVHTGQSTAGFVSPTVQPVPTSILTSGGLAAFSGGNWRIRGWLDHFEPDVDVRDTWETLPHLAWQIDFEDEPRAFFQLIEPGADHLMLVPTRNAYFWNVQARGWSPPGGWPGVWNPPGGWSAPTYGRLNFFEHPTPLPYTLHDQMRTFNQYAARPGTLVSHPNPLAHPLREPGNSVITGITPNHPPGVIRRMSVGLISPRGVVAFNGNELFDGLIIVGVDYYYRNQVVTWSRMYVDDAPPNGRLTSPDYTFYSGMLNLSADDAGPWEGEGCRNYYCLAHGGTEYCLTGGNVNGHQVRITALGYHDAWTCITIDQVSQLGDGRVLVRVPMRRAPIDNIVLTLHNDSAYISESQDLQPGINTARDPRARSSRDSVNSHYRTSDSTWVAPLGLHSVPPWGRVQAGPRHQDLPPHSHFDISGSYWHDLLTGMGNGFSTESLVLLHSAIENPHNENPSPENPFIVRIGLRDIDLPDMPLRIVRVFEHDDEDLEEAEIYLNIPHGGRAGNNTPYYWFYSGGAYPNHRFRVELRNPDGVRHSNNQSPRIISGASELLTQADLSTAGPATLAQINTPGAANNDANRRSSTHWWISNVTEYTEVRVIPRPSHPILSPAGGSTNADGETTGNGGDITRSFRPSEWIPLHELIEWSNDDEESEADHQDPLRITVPIEYEDTRRVAVIERHIIIEGQVHEHRIPIPDATLRVLADVGLDSLEDRWQVQNPPNTGIFNPVRFIDGEEAEATAPGWSAEREVLNALHPGDVDETIYIMLARNPLARIYGFVLSDAMLVTPETLAYITGATVNIIDRATGAVIATTTSGTRGFFEVFLPDGTFPGSYLVVATHPTLGFGTSVPSPVDIPAGGDNARVNIFLGNAGYFPIFVRTLDAGGNNVSNTCTAILTYGLPTSPRTSVYDSPYKLIMARTDDRTGANGWINGNITVNTLLGIPVGMVNINQYLIDYPLHNPASTRYQFLIITLRQGIPDWRRLNNAINAITDPPDRIIIHPRGTTGVTEIEMDGGIRIFNLVITDEGDGNTITTVPITLPNSDTLNPHRIRVTRQVSVEAAPGANIVLLMAVPQTADDSDIYVRTVDETPWLTTNYSPGRHFIIDTGGVFTLGGGTGTIQVHGNSHNDAPPLPARPAQVTGQSTMPALVASNVNRRGGINVIGGGHLILENGSAVRNSRVSDSGDHNTGGGGVFLNNSTLTLRNGSRIFNNMARVNGGGVLAYGDNSRINMYNGAEIHNNSALFAWGWNQTAAGSGIWNASPADLHGGGGVRLNSASRFYMHGGSIHNNRAHRGGGVRIHASSVFTMNNGLITLNRSGWDGPAGFFLETEISGNGGGVLVEGISLGGALLETTATARFFMNGGRVYDNTARNMVGGVYLRNNSLMVMRNNAAVEGNRALTHHSGGVWVHSRSRLEMHNDSGVINNTSFTGAAGVRVESENSRLIMNNNASVSGNIVNGTNVDYSSGGGVRIMGAAYGEMHGGTISNNISENGFGGGVWVGGNFTMTAGTIAGNEARGTAGDSAAFGNSGGGGGVQLHGANAHFIMTGGIIMNNAAERDGGGVHIAPAAVGGNGGTFDFRGGVIGDAVGHDVEGVTVFRGNRAQNGGGIFSVRGIVNMLNHADNGGNNTGRIYNNEASSNGGGIYLFEGAAARMFRMQGSGGIRYNDAGNNGGGVFLNNNSTFAFYGGTIGDNEGANGGGVHVSGTAANFELRSDAAKFITRNRARTDGGGVWVGNALNTRMYMADGAINLHIANNSANITVGMGGGIFTADHGSYPETLPTNALGRATIYQNLRLNPGIPGGTPGTVFSGNTASFTAIPPANVRPPSDPAVTLPNINWTGSLSPASPHPGSLHPLNNDDINFGGDEVDFAFIKVRGSQNVRLPGVVFHLYRRGDWCPIEDDYLWDHVDTDTSRSTAPIGEVSFKLTLTGIYRLVEFSVPDMIILPQGYWTIPIVSGVPQTPVRSNSNIPNFIMGAPFGGLAFSGYHDYIGRAPDYIGNAPNYGPNVSQDFAYELAHEEGFGGVIGDTPGYINPAPLNSVLMLPNDEYVRFDFLKTDIGIYRTPIEINLLPNAEFMVFRAPAASVTSDTGLVTMGGSNVPNSPWQLIPTKDIINLESTDNANQPVAFNMNPSYVYQLVEIVPPPGFRVPGGQWRIWVVSGAITTEIITDGVFSTPGFRVIPCDCPDEGTDDCIRPTSRLLSNHPDFSLPVSGGTGMPISLAIAGSMFLAIACVGLFAIKIHKGRLAYATYASKGDYGSNCVVRGSSVSGSSMDVRDRKEKDVKTHFSKVRRPFWRK